MRFIRGGVCLAAVLAVFVSTTSPADTVLAIVSFHTFERGPAIVRETLVDAWSREATFSYESGKCTASSSFIESNGYKDKRPVLIDAIQVIGDQPSATAPAYLVAGSRTLWLGHATPPRFEELPCTWLIVFDGNRIASVREATELSYLMRSKTERH